jgi:cyclic pyranopterin phosphate synthase
VKDSYDREVNSLRLSVTQQCNLNCFYCHKEGQRQNAHELSVAEIEALVRVASSLGIKNLKLTGGEPLVRPDIVQIVERVAPYVADLSLTTNGVLLSQYAHRLKEAGLSRLNISLPSTNADIYRVITGKAYQPRVIEGIQKAAGEGFRLIKINTVVLKGINDGEFDRLIQFCQQNDAILQLIEVETSKEKINGTFYQRYHLDLIPLEKDLEEKAIEVRTKPLHHRKQYVIPFHDGRTATIEVVRPMHNTEFCANCTRLRATADGKIKTCLFSDNGMVDIAALARQGDDAGLKEAFITAIKNRRPYWQ